MRESLTVLAILLIVVLTTALVGPYFVDWDSHRGRIEHRLSILLGADVRVTGPIDVKLLPRPIFRMEDVTMRALDPQAGTATASRLDMELSLTSLLRGEILFVEADVTAPVVTLPLAEDGAVRLPQVAADDAGRISLVHVVLREGTLVLRKPDGRAALTLGGIAGEGEATSLLGPFKFGGSVDTSRGAVAMQVATGVLEGGRMRLKGSLESAAAGVPRTDLDGLVTATGAGGAARLGFDGTASMAGTLPFADTAAVVPWRLAGKLHAEFGGLSLKDGELRAGADGRALIATATGDVTTRDGGTARLSLRARQADAGRLAVPADQLTAQGTAAVGGGNAPPQTLADDLRALNMLAADADLTAGFPVPVTVDIGLDTLTAGSLALVDLSGSVTLAPGRPVTGTLAAGTPDGARLKLDGGFEAGPAAVFKGRIEAASPRLKRLLDTLAGDLPEVAAAVRRALPFDSVTAAGAVDLSAIGFAAHDVTVALDRSTFAGTVTLTRAVGPDPARLFADLTSDALDLEALPDWREAATAGADLDVSFALVARALKLASSDTGNVSAGRIALNLNKTGPMITLERLSLADLGGATADIRGRSDRKTAHAEGRLDARSLRDLLAVVDRLAPGSIADRLRASGDALSPALLSVAADARIEPDGSVTPTLVTVEGTAAATKLAFSLRPEETGDKAAGEDAVRPFTLRLKLDAADSGQLLQQTGLSTATATAIGRGQVTIAASRDRTGATRGTLAATFGDTALSADGRGDAAGATTARVSLKSPNMAPLARALLIATPETGARWPVDAAGTVVYRNGRFTSRDIAAVVVGTGVRADLAYAMPASTATDAAPLAALTGSLSVDRLPLPFLAGLVLGPLPVPKPPQLFAEAAFAPAPFNLPRSDIQLSAAAMPLAGPTVAQNAKATLRLAPGTLTLADWTASLGTGRIGGTVTLHRDGAAASLSSHLEWSGLPVASPSLGGLSGGALDLAGTGSSLTAVVASLGGSGTLALDNAVLPRFEAGAISRVIAKVDAQQDSTTLDDMAIAQWLGQELDRGALSLGRITTPVTVAAGALRVPPVRVQAASLRAEASGSLDLARLLLSMRATASLEPPPKDWAGSAPEISVIWKGPFASPSRDVDAATLVNGVAARAIARDQARIEAFQDDIRERAFFARRLRAIEAEQQAARDKAKGAADADRLRLQQLFQGAIGPGSPAADAGHPSASATPVPSRRPPSGGKPQELH